VPHQRKLFKVRLQAGVGPERDRKNLGESPLEEDGPRPVAQQAAKRVGRRLDRLCSLHREQKRIGVNQAVERVQRHLVAHDLVAKRHHLVDTKLGALVPKVRVPMDLGHAVDRVVRQPGLRHHVNEVRQRLVMRLDTTRVRTSAVAHAHVIQTVVGDPRDPINHLQRFHVCVVRATSPKLAQDLQVRGAIHFQKAPCGGMRPVDSRPAIGNAAVHHHRGRVRHSFGRSGVLTLAAFAALATDAALAARAARAADAALAGLVALAALAADVALAALATLAADAALALCPELAADAALAALAAPAADAALAALAALAAFAALAALDALAALADGRAAPGPPAHQLHQPQGYPPRGSAPQLKQRRKAATCASALGHGKAPCRWKTTTRLHSARYEPSTGCQLPSASWLSPCRRGSEVPTTTAPSGADDGGAAHAGHPAAATTGLHPARPPAPARMLPATRLRRHAPPRASAPQRELPTKRPRMPVVEAVTLATDQPPRPRGPDRRPFTARAANAATPARACAGPRSPNKAPAFRDLAGTARTSRWRYVACLHSQLANCHW